MENRIRILATSDVHGYIYPYSYADGKSAYHGLARISTLISLLRDENTIVIDNGDVLEGSPLAFRYFHKEGQDVSPITEAMEKAGYDYVNIGNHDFNYGTKPLFDHLRYLSAPCITSNLDYKGKPYGPTWVIREVAGKKVALFGLVTQHIPHWERKANIKNCRFRDAFETAKHTVQLLKDLENPDLIICVYHGGFERDLVTGYPTEELTGENEGYRMLKEIRGIDILITGHQHRSVAGTLFGTAYTQTAANGAELACIDVYTDTGVIEPRILKADTEADPKITAAVQEAEDDCQVWLDQPLGVCETDLEVRDEFDGRLHKSQVITFLNKVQSEVSGADISASALFIGATGFRRNITMRDLVSTYVYPNTLVVKKITGKVLRQYLEKCAEFWSIRSDAIIVAPNFEYPKPMHFNYDMADGVEYTIRVSNDIGSRIEELTYQGQPVTDDMELTLCINNYRAAGSGGFSMLSECPTVREIQTSMVEILAEYIMDKKVISFEPVHNIRVVR